MEQWIPANSKGKRQDICLRTESQENVGHAARQQPQAHKSFYQRMVKEWQSQSPDLNPIKILCKDLSKQFIGGNPPTSQFKWSCTKEWAKTPTCYCAGLISIYKKLYLQLLQQKGTESKDSHTFATHRYVTLDHFLDHKIFFSHLFDLVAFVYFQDFWWSFGSYSCRNIKF